ncbi:MAG TPA: chromosome partitioning protein ParB, partial [Candidatus Coatesbacteria bacterium]|nr:chromosome partitioning protein ParB [Candidatus Coatesbacteria bacterium]
MSGRDKRRGLARGLDDLLGNLADPRSAAENPDAPAPVSVSLEQLLPNP